MRWPGQSGKTRAGYTGFACYSAPDVTLEDDLQRRDLTINAIAQSADGTLHDPYHGADDLKNRVLRHVSAAFTEDPLRVLRVARFAARFAPQGFVIAPETLALMSAITQQGELAHLTAERVWKETEKALNSPCRISILRYCVIAVRWQCCFRSWKPCSAPLTGRQAMTS